MLTILHTADWHLGLPLRRFDPDGARKLGQARLSVIETILGMADFHEATAVLCAGDLFDRPDPDKVWWQGLAGLFAKRTGRWDRPVVLLPGNHDPLMKDSPYQTGHPFRDGLPRWVHVVDRDDFSLDLPADAVVLAAPCRSTAGDKDLALSLPARPTGDTRIRIGLVHGSTFDMKGHQTNFPIAHDAAEQRGLDYLAIGDTHGFREVPEGAQSPIVYPGTPETTSFGERDAGYVAVVSFRAHGRRPTIRRARVARWTWRQEAVKNMADLRALAAGDLLSTVLKLHLDLEVTPAEDEELDRLLAELRGTDAAPGRAGVLDADRAGVRVQLGSGSDLPEDVSPVVRAAAARLHDQARTDPVAREALVMLHRLLREAG